MISYSPLESVKGTPMLAQNRQYQVFHSPTYIYPIVPALAATLLKENGYEVVWSDGIAERLKQRRRIRDYLYFKKKNMRRYPWQETNTKGLVKFILSTLLVFPLVFDSLRGHTKIRDRACFFHIPACWLTLGIYGFTFLKSRLFKVDVIRGVEALRG